MFESTWKPILEHLAQCLSFEAKIRKVAGKCTARIPGIILTGEPPLYSPLPDECLSSRLRFVYEDRLFAQNLLPRDFLSMRILAFGTPA